MTLKTDYTTALNTALTNAFTAGEAFATANIGYSDPPTNQVPLPLTAACKTAAASGQNTFTVFLTTSYNPEALKLNGNFLKSYLAGIYYGLTAQGVYHTYEVTLSLDTSTVGTNKIKFSFTFNP